MEPDLNRLNEEIVSIFNWMPLLFIIIIWDAIWKIIALWKSARKNQLAWFICIAIFNTIGILPIIYLLMHRKK